MIEQKLTPRSLRTAASRTTGSPASPVLAATTAAIATLGAALTLSMTSSIAFAATSCDFQKPVGVCQVLSVPAAKGSYFQLGPDHQCASVDYAVAGRSKRLFMSNGRAEDPEANGDVSILGCVTYAETTVPEAPAPAQQMSWTNPGGVQTVTQGVTVVARPQVSNPLAVLQGLGNALTQTAATQTVSVPTASWVQTPTVTTNYASTIEALETVSADYVTHSGSTSFGEYETVVKGPTKSTLGSPDLVTTYTESVSAPRYSHTIKQPIVHETVVHAPVVQTLPVKTIVKPTAAPSGVDFGGCCKVGPVSLVEMSPAVEGSWCHDTAGTLHVASDRMTMDRSNGTKVTVAFISRGTYSLTYKGQMVTPYSGLIAPTTDGKLLWREKVWGALEKDHLMTRCDQFVKRPSTIWLRNGVEVGRK